MSQDQPIVLDPTYASFDAAARPADLGATHFIGIGGAGGFLTQPVFTEEDAARLRRIKEETGAKILCGIMPLISRKNAMFMKNEIAGVNVTDEIVARYPEKANRKEGEAAGIQLAKEVMKMVEDFADGYYFSFPFNRVYMLQDIMGK